MTGRQVVIARVQFVKNLNGSQVDEGERRDSEVLYTKRVYEEFIKEHKLEQKVENLEDPKLSSYVQ